VQPLQRLSTRRMSRALQAYPGHRNMVSEYFSGYRPATSQEQGHEMGQDALLFF
jgi:hypothetical protein